MVTYRVNCGLRDRPIYREVKVSHPLTRLSNCPAGVVLHPDGSADLKCGLWTVVTLYPHVGAIRTYGEYDPTFGPYISAFLAEYAPSIKYRQLKPYIAKCGTFSITTITKTR